MKRAILLLLLLVAACQGDGPTNPTVDTTTRGRLSGMVTIGPGTPQPSAYLERKVLVYNEAKTQLLFTVDIDTLGVYLISLAPGRYTVDLQKPATDKSSDVPATVTVERNLTTVLNITIDAGTR